MNTINTVSSPLDFTDAAAIKVRSLIEEEANYNLNLRVFITGGGCSGFQYGFTFDEKINEDDIVVNKEVRTVTLQAFENVVEEGEGGQSGQAGQVVIVKLLIDALSFPYLKDAKIDFREDVSGEHFVINNPNAKTTCGCGSSFAA